jgi:hypothetical protein
MATELSNGNWVGISVLSGVIIACLIGGVGTGISNTLRPSGPSYSPPIVADPVTPSTPNNPSDLAQGDPGGPFAVAPLTCAAACFGEREVALVALTANEFGDAGLPFTQPVEGSTTAADALVGDLGRWDATGVSPDECFATFSDLPLVEREGMPARPDYIGPLSEQTGSGGTDSRLTQFARLFPDSQSAEGYMIALYTDLQSCPAWRTVSNGVERPVYLEANLFTPDSVASFGFVVEPQIDERRFVFDLQRGNMVIRTVVTTSAGYTDADFRDLVQQQADALDALEPVL